MEATINKNWIQTSVPWRKLNMLCRFDILGLFGYQNCTTRKLYCSTDVAWRE